MIELDRIENWCDCNLPGILLVPLTVFVFIAWCLMWLLLPAWLRNKMGFE